jgi:hypothetical protein
LAETLAALAIRPDGLLRGRHVRAGRTFAAAILERLGSDRVVVGAWIATQRPENGRDPEFRDKMRASGSFRLGSAELADMIEERGLCLVG